MNTPHSIFSYQRRLLIKTFASGILCFLLAAFYSTADAAMLNVPGDFSQPVNYFSMELIGGILNLDEVDVSNGRSITLGNISLNTTGYQIPFTATQFNNIGPGQGTSILTANFNNYMITSSSDLYGYPVSFYLNGQATGTLVDNGDSTQGHWTLNAHLYANWGPFNGIDIGTISLSTATSYNYCDTGVCFPNTDDANTATGAIMDYNTGLAYMVGQGVIQSGRFAGIRVTLGLQGQDPVATVPLPAAAWLFGTGLLGLIGVARRKAA